MESGLLHRDLSLYNVKEVVAGVASHRRERYATIHDGKMRQIITAISVTVDQAAVLVAECR